MALTISATNVELTPPVDRYLEQTYLRNARSRCPYFMGTVPGELSEHKGTKVLSWPTIANLSVVTAPLAGTGATSSTGELAGEWSLMGGRDAAALSASTKSATPVKYGNFVILNEEAARYNISTQMDKIMQVMGINAGQSLNKLQGDYAGDNLTQIFAGSAASDGAITSAITANDIKNAVNTIDRLSGITFNPMSAATGAQVGSGGTSDATSNGLMPSYWGICHPDVAVDISGLTGFIAAERYAGNTNLGLSEFGAMTVGGKTVRFLSTEDAPVDADAGAAASSHGLRGTSDIDVYSTIIYGQDCIGTASLGDMYPDGTFMAGDPVDSVDVIVKGLGSGGTSDPFNEVMTVAWKAFWDSVILNANWGRCIRSGATDLA